MQKYIKKELKASFFYEFVRMKGLEPPRLSAPDPKSGTATNYATSAKEFAKIRKKIKFCKILFFFVSVGARHASPLQPFIPDNKPVSHVEKSL